MNNSIKMGDDGTVNIPNVRVNKIPDTTVQTEVWVHMIFNLSTIWRRGLASCSGQIIKGHLLLGPPR
jgi:hypothetical protein